MSTFAPRPIEVTRRDGVLVPKQRWLFDKLFPADGDYIIEPFEPRSTKSQNHYHAAVNEAWKNLPEDLANQHPDAEHLRKWALIKTGWCIKQNVVCESVDQAIAFAAVAGKLNESAVIVVQGKVVTIATARTQKTTGPGCMNREEFQKSKQDVLEYVASLIGVDASALSSHVSNSSGDSTNGSQANRTDAPAAKSDPQSEAAAGALLPSTLKPGWFDTYVITLTQASNRAMSVMSRDELARRNTGEPNEWERQLQREIATAVNKRDQGKVSADEFHQMISAVRAKFNAAKGATNAA
ncbi:hypothetical protein [Bradyrhizobium sp. SZCCHNR3015]|uniref:hypothetical protein n=1 Tax=Bradyrhizobium sp. SZCCHNR3015 TaxID=3057395 RepID=UPI0029165D59|nr:hypothetical protein [Bradyrhizobium sp. SZCCHNR3015]